MNDAKHTPGDWSIEEGVTMKGFTHLAIVNRAHSDWFICSVTPMHLARERDYANADLIRRAPALLADNERLREALREIVERYDADDWFCEWCDRHAPKHSGGPLDGRLTGEKLTHRPECVILKARAALSAMEGAKSDGCLHPKQRNIDGALVCSICGITLIP